MSAGTPPLVAHVIHRLDYGGLENGVVNLVNRMPPERYRHAIVCLAGFAPEFRARIRRDDVEVLTLDKKPGKDVAVYARMWRMLRRLRPAVVHTRNLGTVDMQWLAAAAGVRGRVHGEHGLETSDLQGRHPRALRIRRACRPLIHRYVPMSQDLARWLERDVGVSSDRIRQIYSGVDTVKFRPRADALDVAMPKTSRMWPAGCPWQAAGRDDAIVVGTVGRLDPVKNQSALLAAFRSILDHRTDLAPRLRLLIVGDGPLRAQVSETAVRLGLERHLWLAGARDDVPALMQAMDVFVLPSLREGISNTILEAMATGLPVVAARAGGNPELILDGLSGALYDDRDPAGLERALLRYVDDAGLRRRHGLAGRERVVQDFSLDAMVRGYCNLYDELLSGA